MAVIKSLSTGIKPEKTARWSNSDNTVYKTARWAKFRKAYIMYRLAQGHADCDSCNKPFREQYRTIAGKVIKTQGIEIDHIRPISQGGETFDYSNLQMLCHHCHKSKTAKEIRGINQ